MDSEKTIDQILPHWEQLNANRNISSNQRTEAKLASIHQLIRELGAEHQIDNTSVEELIEEHQIRYKDPKSLLSAYRCYLPTDCHRLLITLERSEAINSQLRILPQESPK